MKRAPNPKTGGPRDLFGGNHVLDDTQGRKSECHYVNTFACCVQINFRNKTDFWQMKGWNCIPVTGIVGHG